MGFHILPTDSEFFPHECHLIRFSGNKLSKMITLFYEKPHSKRLDVTASAVEMHCVADSVVLNLVEIVCSTFFIIGEVLPIGYNSALSRFKQNSIMHKSYCLTFLIVNLDFTKLNPL